MNPLFAQLALDWLEAEREANPERWPAVPKRDDMTIAIDRVYQVVSGNVLWSEASPGDKAIWKSRVEDIPAFGRTWRRKGKPIEPEEQKLDDPYNQVAPRPPPRSPRAGDRFRVWWNYYDTVQVTQRGLGSPLTNECTDRSWILFRSIHVGSPFLCNLQIGRALAADATFVVQRFYVSVSSLASLHWAADRALFRFVIGDQPRGPEMFLRDLFRGVQIQRPYIIPVRQNFSAHVSLKDYPPADLPPFDMTFHMEGLESRNVY